MEASAKNAMTVGVGVALGEMIFGSNGPFLFGRLGLDVPLAIAAGLVCGAVVGLTVTGLWIRLRSTEPAAQKGVRPAHANPHPRPTL